MLRSLLFFLIIFTFMPQAKASRCRELLRLIQFRGEEMKTKTAEQVIQKLALRPLPGEGGYYRETYRSKNNINVTFPGETTPVERSLNTQIYYLVTEDSFSALHRLKQDEIYNFYDGLAAEIFLIYQDGTSKVIRLGKDIAQGETPQLLIPAGTWQGVRLATGQKGYSLMGTSVSPGFEFADFELGDRKKLINQLPNLKSLIETYTRAE
jgi:uncharacterized protein